MKEIELKGFANVHEARLTECKVNFPDAGISITIRPLTVAGSAYIQHADGDGNEVAIRMMQLCITGADGIGFETETIKLAGRDYTAARRSWVEGMSSGIIAQLVALISELSGLSDGEIKRLDFTAAAPTDS